MNSMCNWFVNYLIHKGIINENKKAIYLYGMKLAIYKVVYALIILSMCFILKRSFFNLCLFYCSYISIRKYSGGYHAPNVLICIFVFAITYYLLDWFIFLLLDMNSLVAIILSILLIYLIFKKSTCDCENKRLSIKEKVKYKKFTLYVSVFWLTVSMLFIALKSTNYLTILYTYLSIYLFLLI